MPIDNCEQILFFSRGKGRGHAIPDIAIARELRAIRGDIDVLFVSYATGASTFRERGERVIDLELPEDNPVWDTVLRINDLLHRHHPLLVVAHEEFVVVPLAKSYGLPVVFLTDWFAPEEWLNMQALRYADGVVFLDEPGYHDEPSYLRGKISYAGLVFRELEPSSSNRVGARAALGLPEMAKVILVLPGGADCHSEARAPICDLLFEAFDLLEADEKRLIWVASGADYDLLQKRSSERRDLIVMNPHVHLTSTMMASDLVVTKGNRTPLLECELLGLPSLSLSHGHNPVDDYRIARIRSNTALRVRALSSGLLRDYMLKAMAGAPKLHSSPVQDIERGRLNVARRILNYLEQEI